MSRELQAAALKAQLDALPEEEMFQLFRLLPESEANKLKNMPSFNLKYIHSLPLYAFLGKIHPSWILMVLQNFNQTDRLLFISAFSQRRNQLADACNLPHEYIPLTQIGRMFLIEQLYQKLLKSSDLLPLPFLYHEHFFRLLTLSYDQMETLIYLLGLHDIALEIQTLIRKEQIQAINDSLSPPLKKYLQQIIQQKNDVSFAKLQLASWDGDIQKLNALIHKRGLNRLGKVIGYTSKNLQGHLFYLLSKEEASLLKGFFSKQKNEKVIQSLIKQVDQAIDYVLELEK